MTIKIVLNIAVNCPMMAARFDLIQGQNNPTTKIPNEAPPAAPKIENEIYKM